MWGAIVTCGCRTVESSDVVKSIPAGVGRLRNSVDNGIISRGGTAGVKRVVLHARYGVGRTESELVLEKLATHRIVVLLVYNFPLPIFGVLECVLD